MKEMKMHTNFHKNCDIPHDAEETCEIATASILNKESYFSNILAGLVNAFGFWIHIVECKALFIDEYRDTETYLKLDLYEDIMVLSLL